MLSFLLLRGQCRACRASIGWRYPLVEEAVELLLVALWVHFAPPAAWAPFVAAGVFALILEAVSVIDLDHQIVPNAITYSGLAVGLLLAIPRGGLCRRRSPRWGPGRSFLLVAIVSRGGMGGSDIKLAAMMGAFLRWPAITVALLLAFMGGQEPAFS